MPKTAECPAQPTGTLDATTRNECLTSIQSLGRCVARAAAEAIIDGDDEMLAALHRGLIETLEDAHGSTWRGEDYVDSLLDRAARLIKRARTLASATEQDADRA